MNKNTFIVGFTLFAIFFGAGNLIFPPKLGLESGSEFWSAITGFILSGVGLPLLGIIVSAFYEGGYKTTTTKISPWFSVIFLMAVYLSIGPFFAIPRTAATSYEMAILPFIGKSSSLSMLIFTLFYFAISLWFALNPSKTVSRIGAILTPILLFAILALVVKAFFILIDNDPSEVIFTLRESNNSFLFTGIIDGYLTMDTLASIAYSVIVIAAIQSKGIKHGKELTKQTLLAGIVAAIALAAIYLAIGWIGNRVHISAETISLLQERNQDIGTYILNKITAQAFGNFGRSLLGVIVSLACLTTAIGLIVSVSEYFNEIYHKISYKTYVIIFTLIGFIIANQGLSAVISKSVPILLVLYPISMTIILLLSVNIFVKVPLVAQRLSIALTTLVSIGSVAGLEQANNLPLKDYSMEWIPFAVTGALLGCLIHVFYKSES
ncbi:branched-chain amino acid transport system II carrier protein [Basfia succiniciproducens]|uniref:branched-chain amino acid transport system II carrier protein n=1 Tax=Basfia succiniciproducens TaxID=653940 RepID=UPI003FCCEE60